MKWKKKCIVLVSIVLVVGLAYFSSFSSSVIPGDLQTENFDHLATF